MVKLHLLIGIPGSGKTTYANKIIKKKDIAIVSTDVVRMTYSGIKEDDVWPTVYKMLGEYLVNKKDVIFDATNITPKVRNRLIENIYSFTQLKHLIDYEIVSYYFPTYTEICEKRVNIRNHQPGELFLPTDVISSYQNRIIPPTYEEKFIKTKVISSGSRLLKGLVKNSYQGYVFYYKQKDEIIEECSGFANIDISEPLRYNYCFRLASVSKQFIAYGIMTLVENKKLSLDESIYNIFDNMPEYTKDITVKNLLNHTSGLYDYEDMPHTDKQVSDNDVLNYIRTTNNTYFEIGSKYQYSNTAYVLLGLIIEKVSNSRLGDYMNDYVFKPAKMVNTCVDYEPITMITPRAYGHILYKGKLFKKDQYWCSATIGDGGIYSNIQDLKSWLKYLKALNLYPYNLMKAPNIINDINTEYGFGLRIKDLNGHKVIYHCGDTIGTNTLIGYIEDLDMEFVFLTNMQGIDTSKFIQNLRKIIK